MDRCRPVAGCCNGEVFDDYPTGMAGYSAALSIVQNPANFYGSNIGQSILLPCRKELTAISVPRDRCRDRPQRKIKRSLLNPGMDGLKMNPV